MDRRMFMNNSATLALLLLSRGFVASASSLQRAARPDPQALLRAAREAAKWILNSSIQTPQGVVWPAVPPDPKTQGTDLYHGSSGVILFLIELFHATGDQLYLDKALHGTNFLLASIPQNTKAEMDFGLYSGLSGVAFTLEKVYQTSRAPKYREGTLRILSLAADRAPLSSRQASWNDSTDIISGTAGIGLGLLHLNEQLHSSRLLELASAAGHDVIAKAKHAPGGLYWPLGAHDDRSMPGFAHGTAGVCFFLSRLFQATGDRVFLNTALEGASHLKSIANTQDGKCLIYHISNVEGQKRYYLSWCHGPAGTARLFHALSQITGDPQWRQWINGSALGILGSGAPESQTPGFWNNQGRCCGSAGIGEFFIGLQAQHENSGYAAYLDRITQNILEKATQDTTGMRWVHAENRIEPQKVFAQTGLMQGAAGIGLFLTHQYLQTHGRKPSVVLPDSPFST